MIVVYNRHSPSLHTDYGQMCILKDPQIHTEMERNKNQYWRPSSLNKRGTPQKNKRQQGFIDHLYTWDTVSNIQVQASLSYQNVHGIIYACWITCRTAANQERKEAAFGDENCFPVTDCTNQSSTREIRSKRWPIIAKHCCTHEAKKLMHKAQKSNSLENVAEFAILKNIYVGEQFFTV